MCLQRRADIAFRSYPDAGEMHSAFVFTAKWIKAPLSLCFKGFAASWWRQCIVASFALKPILRTTLCSSCLSKFQSISLLFRLRWNALYLYFYRKTAKRDEV